jgi:hypothetical protein
MKMIGVNRHEVSAAWKMRPHRWLDMYTLESKYSIEVHEPKLNKWAHIYEENARDGKLGVMFFETEELALRLIQELKETT